MVPEPPTFSILISLTSEILLCLCSIQQFNNEKNFIYIGYSENLKQRIQEHNEGKVKSTKAYLPLKLIFYEAYPTKSDAKRREKYLKSNKGKTALMTMLKDYFGKQ